MKFPKKTIWFVVISLICNILIYQTALSWRTVNTGRAAKVLRWQKTKMVIVILLVVLHIFTELKSLLNIGGSTVTENIASVQTDMAT